MLGIQTNLINLYSNNLSAVATQAALIGGFSFTAVSMVYDSGNVASLALGYFYYFLFTITLVSSLFILSQATIVVMFGPTMALKGSTDEAVKYAAGHMMNQQLIILRAAAIAISSLFLAACILSWANYPLGVAAITTVVYLVGYYYVVKLGYEAYRTFVPEDEGAFLEPLLEMAGMYQGGNDKTNSNGEHKDDEMTMLQEKLAIAQEVCTHFLNFHLTLLSLSLSLIIRQPN